MSEKASGNSRKGYDEVKSNPNDVWVKYTSISWKKAAHAMFRRYRSSYFQLEMLPFFRTTRKLGSETPQSCRHRWRTCIPSKRPRHQEISLEMAA